MKRSYLKRGTKPLKRTKPMPRMKASTKAKRATLYCDSFGVPFGDVRKWLPGRTSDWPSRFPLIVPKNIHVCGLMHDLETHYGSGDCWLCGKRRVLEAHHVVSRWDFHGNICMVCRECHGRVQHSQTELPAVLRAMQRHNQFLSWVHLTRARGSHWLFDTLD